MKEAYFPLLLLVAPSEVMTSRYLDERCDVRFFSDGVPVSEVLLRFFLLTPTPSLSVSGVLCMI